MKIKTKTNVTYNSGVASMTTGVIYGEIGIVSIFNNMNTVSINYRYTDVNGSIVSQSSFDISNEDIDTLSLNVFQNLPENYNELSERERMQLKYYSGFALKTAETFGINISDIEFLG